MPVARLLFEELMRIAIVSEWFSENVGYAENCLPKALAALGHEVHVVTSDLQVYHNTPFYHTTYEPYLGPSVVPEGSKRLDGYVLHRLPHTRWRGQLRIRGLCSALRSLRPNVVQTFDTTSVNTAEAALARIPCGYRLFTGQHWVASVTPLAREYDQLNWKGRLIWAVRLALPGRAISLCTERCYAVTPDAVEIASRLQGVPPNKVTLSPLGVDTDLFYPPTANETAQAERAALRAELGFRDGDIVCVYSGRFTAAKNPACLAQAVSLLAGAGLPFRALFVGDGPQEPELRAISGCVVRPFAPYRHLPAYYRAADIGVWPMEESTSMLDAAACGLPLVINERLRALDHLVGCWARYRGGDAGDLARVLATLADPDRRREMGATGVAKIGQNYSWLSIARGRIQDYRAALGGA